jgi:Ca-activated chloride channel homolog
MGGLLSVILAFFLLQTATLHAQTQAPAVLYCILDASGSMGPRIGDRTKMAGAKKVFHELIEGMPSDMAFGLMVYGHRKKADCSDIVDKLEVPAGSLVELEL